jgi:hypothetical protein
MFSVESLLNFTLLVIKFADSGFDYSAKVRKLSSLILSMPIDIVADLLISALECVHHLIMA